MRRMRLGLIVFAIICIIGLTLIPAFYSKAQSNPVSDPQPYYTSIKIEDGYTLSYLESIYNTSNILSSKEYISELKRINSLDSDIIHAGCNITIIGYNNAF